MAHDANEIVSPLFDFLIAEHGLRLVSRKVEPCFDNVSVVLSSPGLIVNIFRDRGSVSVRLGRSLDISESTALHMLRILVLNLDPLDEVSIEEEADFLRTNFTRIKELFSDQNLRETMRRIQSLGRERGRRMFPGKILEDP
jgi:hypothetical protein